jgi:hypothetical protein
MTRIPQKVVSADNKLETCEQGPKQAMQLIALKESSSLSWKRFFSRAANSKLTNASMRSIRSAYQIQKVLSASAIISESALL